MTSLNIALLFFLLTACLIFSIVYAVVDNHSTDKIRHDIFANVRVYFLGLIACGVFINLLQGYIFK